MAMKAPQRRIRYAIAGSGWRAMFFVRAAQKLPEWFELCGVLCHTKEKAQALAAAMDIPTFWNVEDILARQPEFVVSCVSKKNMCGFAAAMLKAGMPVLAETPLAVNVDDLRGLYETQKRTGVPLELAEQYFLWPSHIARKAAFARCGEAVSCALTNVHDYHAISLMRYFLEPDERRVRITASRQTTPIVVTGDRGGYVTDGRMGTETRTFAQFAYADGKLGLYDFSGTQYHSAIRTNHVRLLGTRGEVFDDEVRWADENGRPRMGKIELRRDVATGTVCAADFDGERVYENPFRSDVTMTEDEIAVADVLRRMGDVVRNGGAFYPAKYRDAYLTCMLEWAAESGEAVTAERMPWDE